MHANFLRSLFLVWIPLSFVAGLIYGVLWGDLHMGSFVFGAVFFAIGRALDEHFGFTP